MSTLSNWRLTTCPLHPVILSLRSHCKTFFIISFNLEQRYEMWLAVRLATSTSCIVTKTKNPLAVSAAEARLVIGVPISYDLFHQIDTFLAFVTNRYTATVRRLSSLWSWLSLHDRFFASNLLFCGHPSQVSRKFQNTCLFRRCKIADLFSVFFVLYSNNFRK